MSDEKLRELERRWRETSAVDDEAAWLAERIRAGQVVLDQVEAIAMMGYPAALIVLGKHPAWLAQQSLLTVINQFGPLSMPRVMLILLGQLCLEMGISEPPARIAAMIAVARTWLDAPTDAHTHRAGVEAELCMAHAEHLYELGSPRVDGVRDPVAPLFELAGMLGRRIRDGDEAEEDLFMYLRESREYHPCLHDEPVRAALREKLVPWFLGYGDPLNIEKAGTP